MQFIKTPLFNMHRRIKQGVRTVESLNLKLNRDMMPIMLANGTCLKGRFLELFFDN